MGCHGESWYPKSSNAPQLLQLLFHTTTQVISVSSWGRWGSNHPTSPEVCRCSAPMTTQRFDLETVPTNESMLVNLVNQALLLSSVPCMKTCEPLRKKFGLGPVPSLSNRSLGPAAFQAVKTCVDALHTLHNLAIAADEESDCHRLTHDGAPMKPSILGIYCRWFSYEHPQAEDTTCRQSFLGLRHSFLGLPTGKSSESLTETDWYCHEPKTALTSRHSNEYLHIWTYDDICTFYKSVFHGRQPSPNCPPEKKTASATQHGSRRSLPPLQPKKKGSKWGQKKVMGTL